MWRVGSRDYGLHYHIFAGTLEVSLRIRNSMARNPERANLAASLNEKQSENKENVDVTKFPKYRLKYLGSMAVDRRYTPAITLWVVREIAQVQKNRPVQIDFLIETDRLIISNAENGEIIENIGLNSMVRLPRIKKQAKTLAFVSGGKLEADKCFCHVFACETPEAVGSLFDVTHIRFPLFLVGRDSIPLFMNVNPKRAAR